MTNPNAINSTIYNSTAGADSQFNITNASNTAGADAIEIIQVAGGTGGDAYTQWSVNGVTNWVAGLDNSDSDAWVLSASATPGTSNAVIIATSGATQFPLGNVTVTRAEVGGNVILRSTNTDNTSLSSHAVLSAVSGGAAGGDPIVSMAVTGGQTWVIGVDNSNSDRFAISNSTDLGTTDTFRINATTGIITVPLGNFFVQRTAVGSSVTSQVNNLDNTDPASNGSFVASSGGASGGDASLLLQISGVTDWALGCDNSASDAFVISNSTALGTSNAASIAATTFDTTWTGNFLVTRTDVGNDIYLGATNSDGTNAASHASLRLTAATSGGDPRVLFDVTGGGASWSIGTDNSASDAWVISNAFGLGSSNVISIANTTGTVTVGVGDLLVTRANVGGSNTAQVINTDNTNASSSAGIIIQSGGSSAGDSYLQYVVAGTTTWTEGIDNSASDAFVIAASSALGTTNVVSMSTAGATTFPTGNVTVSRSAAAADVTLSITNSDNTSATSNSYCFIQSGGASGGDAYVRYGNGVQGYCWGEDNSDSDAMCLTASTTLNGTNLVRFGSGGIVTFPLTPCFLAYQASDQTNATGNGTAYTLGSTTDLTEVFDQSGSFNPATGTFTAPAGLTTVGKVSLNASVLVTACTIATTFSLSIITSNATYTKTFIKAAGNQSECISYSVLADMDASDTATVTITVSGEAGDTCTVAGSATRSTFFSGKLEC